ncbi:hypothetical protein QYE76_015370 [Lolium multiflorum]|uniref:Zinc knuckle CX2CX4HX4C domain-containing protein n=1 Tax=Lolium multiflorum TaxID=4521 RepID=A0AAD8X6C7_LOLMU|nr:hypothetical protein QYE76_015370 [Lolium multiflorum]
MTGKSGMAQTRADLDRLKAVETAVGGSEERGSEKITGDGVTAMMGRLKLTAKEAKTFVLDDSSQDAFKGPDWALMDMQRVLNGSPWVMGKNAILLKEFDPRILPADVVFDRLLLWVRIYKLPYPLMNSDRGGALAGTIGDVVRVETDENASKKETSYYEVKYEKLPMFCFSCGLVGHSSVACPTPACRDEADQLPWCSDRVCVPEVRWKEQRPSSGQGVPSGQGSSNRPPTSEKKQAEVTSPVKPRKPRAKKNVDPGDDQQGTQRKAMGTKRKQAYVVKTPAPLLLTNSPAIVESQGTLPDDAGGCAEKSDDSNKKQRTTSADSGSADQAGAGAQPRQTQ